MCEHCTHWKRVGETTRGECHRYPPTVSVVAGVVEENRLALLEQAPRVVMQPVNASPTTEQDFECGEYYVKS